MSRSISIDILKAASIFGVVFIHSSNLLGCESAVSEMFQSLFRFAVPCFVVIWAYFVEKSLIVKNRQQQVQYLTRRFMHLFVVFMLWSTLYFLISVNWATLTPVKLITTYFSGFGWAGQYYFIILFQLLVLFPLTRWIYKRQNLTIIVVAVLVVLYFVCAYVRLPSLIDSLGYRVFIYWIPYVFVGIWLARTQTSGRVLNSTDKSENKKSMPAKRLFVSKWWLLTIFFIPAESWLMKCGGLFNDLNEYVRPAVLFVSVVISVFAIQNNIIQHNPIVFIGSRTMTIFVTNSLVIYSLKALFASVRLQLVQHC